MKQAFFYIDQIPAVLYGEDAQRVWLFVHGKCGCKEEGADFARIVCPRGTQVLAVDLPGHGARRDGPGFDPWHTVPELRNVMAYLRQRWGHIALRANSLGAWFSMLAFADTPPEKALLVSPVLDMGKLIGNMMLWAKVSPAQLEREGEIPTSFRETLSWRYWQYAKAHPIIKWNTATEILYAGQDHLTDQDTAADFARRFSCGLTVMKNGEHWFHTPEQLEFLRAWVDRYGVEWSMM